VSSGVVVRDGPETRGPVEDSDARVVLETTGARGSVSREAGSSREMFGLLVCEITWDSASPSVGADRVGAGVGAGADAGTRAGEEIAVGIRIPEDKLGVKRAAV